MKHRRIIVEHVAPPVPLFEFDYRATYDGYEPSEPMGYGATKYQAILDLLMEADQ